MVVVFDFKRACAFGELDLSTRSKKVAVRVEVSDRDQGDWRIVYERGRGDCPEKMFHRLPLSNRPKGRYVRLSVQAESTTWLEEVLLWGDAEVSEKTPEAYQPVTPTPVITGTAFPSIPGIAKSSFADAQYWEWQRNLGAAVKQPAVWSQLSTWDSLTERPILPKITEISRPVKLVMARNETEGAALALTNTSMDKPVTLEISLSHFRRGAGQGKDDSKIRGEVRVGGAIGSRYYGVNIGPLFAADNMLGPSLMLRYLTNGEGIRDFPKVTLSPAGSAIFWLSVTTAGADPGIYEARLSCKGGTPLILRAEVVNVTLPRPFVWLQTWSGTTSMFPFVEGDRAEREVACKQSLGVTVWGGFPTPGSEAALARKNSRALYHLYGLPSDLINKGYASQIKPEGLGDKEEKSVRDHIVSLVKQAAELGLSYDDWYVELWDEPGRSNGLLYGALARLIRKADPRVHIYCNPCFWEGNGVAPDEAVYPALSPWFKENVDLSVPLFLLLRDRPRIWELFNAHRFVRASYNVCAQSAKSERGELTELYRKMAWDAFSRGWNGWGFYSYYAPRGNPWNDFDQEWYSAEDSPDYQIVYPGPRGPILTRQAEAVREGWEDYCLLTLLKQQGKRGEVESLLKSYSAGKPLTELRLRALRLAQQASH